MAGKESHDCLTSPCIELLLQCLQAQTAEFSYGHIKRVVSQCGERKIPSWISARELQSYDHSNQNAQCQCTVWSSITCSTLRISRFSIAALCFFAHCPLLPGALSHPVVSS